MLIAIEGIVETKEPTFLHLNVGGLVYEINVSVNTSSAIDGKRVRLHLTQIIREDANLLYGFADRDEKRMFDTLLKINGIGPKVAQAVCSTFTPSTFARIVNDRDVSTLKRVPGIGPKAAGRILVELADFVIDTDEGEGGALSEAKTEAQMALESLGFGKEAVRKALDGESGDTAQLVKTALKKLQRL